MKKKIVSLFYHTAETSNIHMRTSEGWCLGDVATLMCRSVEASVAPRSVRGLEGLLLGAPPSPDTEDIRLRARRRRSDRRRRRGCVRRTWSEVRRAKVEAPRREAKGRPAQRRDSAWAEDTSSEATQRTHSLHMRKPSNAKGSEAKRPHCQSFVRSVQL